MLDDSVLWFVLPNWISSSRSEGHRTSHDQPQALSLQVKGEGRSLLD